MLEEFERNPGSRVFHVDDECYVVYIGSHWDDYKPFVRIGTSTELPEALKPIVSTIVVPDTLTGNPLDEPESLDGGSSKDTRYLGDGVTVERLKTFLHEENVPTESFQVTDHEEEDARHVFVYFYADGNIKVKFKKHDVLDLKRRERVDHHFSARSQEVKNRFARNPFKLPGDAYQRPAFVVVAGKPYLIARGEIAALDLSDRYFFDLCSAGIDADRLSTVRAQTADRALVNLFKRSRAKSRTLRIATADSERVQNAIALFGESSIPALKANVLESGAEQFSFHRFEVAHTSTGFSASLEELDAPIALVTIAPKRGEKSSAAITANIQSNTIEISNASVTTPLVANVPYTVSAEAPTRSLIVSQYLPEKNIPYRDLLNQNENNLVAQLDYFFNELWGGRDTAKVIKSLKPMLKLINGETQPLMQLVLHNVQQALRFLGRHEPELSRQTESLASLLPREAIDAASIPAYLPLVGDLYVADEDGYLFYRHAQRVTSDRASHAEGVSAETIARPAGTDFEAERKRLEELVGDLANPEEMEAARERRRAAKAAESAGAKPDTAAAKADAKKSSVADAGTATRPAEDTAGASAVAGHSPEGERKSPTRWIIPAAIIVLILGGLTALVLTGVIPNPFADGTQLASDTDGDSDNEDQSDNGDADGDGLTGDRSSEDTTNGETNADRPDPVVPENWPDEALPALEALRDTPGIVITTERVIGPGGIEITVRDIILLVNQIATSNGYAPMHSDVIRERDPDWIYPGNVFVLPDESSYTVVGGDTLWDLTIRYMVARLQQDYSAYTRLVEEHERDSTGATRKAEIESELTRLAERSHTENFVKLVDDKKQEWEQN